MKLFSRKKSNPQISEPPPPPPNISRPRAQGHLQRPPPSTRRSMSGSGNEPPVTTPLYARFARADSLESLSLNLRGPAEGRTPSGVPTPDELDRAGYERPWAREVQASLDAPMTSRAVESPSRMFDSPSRAFDSPSRTFDSGPRTFDSGPRTVEPPSKTLEWGPAQDRARSPLAPGSNPTLRMVSNPPTSTAENRKSTASRRLSMDAAIAADPFLASKMQSVLRRAPSNAVTSNPPTPPSKNAPLPKTAPAPMPAPSRSSTAPPPSVNSRPVPTSRAPTAPPVTTSRVRPSLDLTSDDGHSTFSHSNAGHQSSIRQVTANTSSKRERGPPPVAGTHSAYAWRSGQSDDGHGGGNFYTGGSQSQVQLPALPPGAQPPQPGGQPLKKRTPSNPPVSRVPYPGPSARRVSVDDAARTGVTGVGGGPGTWGGVAPGPVSPHASAPAPAQVNPTPPYGPTTATNQTSSYGPTTNQTSSYGPTPNQNSSYSPTTNQTSSYGPAPNQTSSYGPTTNPTPSYGPTTQPPPPSVPLGSGPIALGGIRSIPNGAARPISPTANVQISGPGFDPYQSGQKVSESQRQPVPQPQRAPEPQVQRVPEPQVQRVPEQQVQRNPQPQPQRISESQAQKVQSVEPGQIFNHTQPPAHTQRPQMSLAEMYPPAPPLPSKRMSMGPAAADRIRTVSGTERVRTTSGTERVRTASTASGKDGRQSPTKEGRTSPVKSIVNGRESPFKATVGGGGSPLKTEGFRPEDRQSSFKPEGRQSPFKPDTGRQTPVKSSSQKSAPPSPQKSISGAQRSTLSVDTTAGSNSARTVTPIRTPVSGSVTSLVGNAPSSSVVASSDSTTFSTPIGAGSLSVSTGANTLSASPARATLSPSPIRSTLSPSPVRSTLSTSPAQPSPARTLPPPSPVRGLPSSPAHGLPSSPAHGLSTSPAQGLPFPNPAHGLPAPNPPYSQPPPSSPARSNPNRAMSSTSASSYATAMPADSEYAFDPAPPPVPGPSRLALGGGLSPLNTNANTHSSGLPSTPRDRLASAKATSEMSTPTSTTMVTAPSRSGRASSPLTIPSESGVAHDSDSESMYNKKRNLLVKTRKLDAANSFRSSEEKERSEDGDREKDKTRMSAGLEMAEDPFARSPPTIVKTMKKTKLPPTPDATPDPNVNEDGDTTPRRGMPLSPPLSADDHEQSRYSAGLGLGIQKHPETVLMTPALTDNEAEPPSMSEIADMSEDGDEMMEPESTTPPGSPPPPKVYPLAHHLATPSLLAALLHELSFRDWNALNGLNSVIRKQFEDTRALREEVLEFWLRGVGYTRWTSPRREVLPLSLRDLNAYMRGVSIAVYRYSAIAESFLAVRAQQEQSVERIPGAASKGNLVRALASSCRAYTKVILRLREQAEAGPGRDGVEFRSPLIRVGHAPLLRVFVPSKEGAWLSDASVLDCEKELKRAGALPALRVGDVVWDAAVGDEGNAGRMVWDGNYLVDLDYTYSTTGELPQYINSLAFSPSYWHKTIRTSNSPLCHIDLAPYAADIARNLQLVQDRVQTETPQGGRHTVVRWVHRSRFHTRPGMPVPNTNPQSVVDQMWDGIIVVEVEGTNEGLLDLQARCGSEVRLFPAKTAGMNMDRIGKGLGKSPFRLLRASSRPGEIWMRAVREKERLV